MLIKYFGLTVNIVEDVINFAHANKNYFCGAEEFYLKIDDIAKYYVKASINTIYIEKAPQLANPQMIDVWLYGTVFAYLLQYHGYLVLHGSAIIYNNRAIIFSGQSGAGKSTLAAKFNAKGYTLLTDDVVAITSDHKQQMVMIPGSNKVKLCSSALQHLGHATDNLRPILNKSDKFELPLALHASTPIPIGAFYELNHNAEVKHIGLESLSGMAKINLLIQNTYRYNMLSSLTNGLKTHLEQIGQLANSIMTYKITRPANQYLLNELADLIEAQITSE